MKLKAQIPTRRTFEILEARRMLTGAPVAPTLTFANGDSFFEEVDAILDTPFDFTGLAAFTVADASFATEQPLVRTTETMVLTVEEGKLKLGSTINLTVTNNNTSSITISTDPTDASAVADLNADLPSLVYTPNPGFTGFDEMEITDTDTGDGLSVEGEAEIDVTTFTGLTPAQLSEAYGFDNVQSGPAGTVVDMDGFGQTIAVIEEGDDPYFVDTGDGTPTTLYPTIFKTSDLFKFDTYFDSGDIGLDALDSNFQVVGVNNGTRPSYVTDPADDQETAEDVEWAHAMAPDASIVLIEIAGNGPQDYASAITTAKDDGASVVVMSSFEGPSAYTGQFNILGLPESDFDVPGMTFIDGSGDNGENSYAPGAYPDVVDVASSDLSVNADASWNSETAWSDSPNGPQGQYANVGGSAGGYSIFPTPTYQQGLTISDGNQTLSNNGERTTPDVSIAGGNNALDYISGGGYFTTSPDDPDIGTEMAADIFAGLVADADQGLSYQGFSALSSMQTLTGLYSVPSQDYHDITSGYNGYSAGPGYDLVSGLGTPIANQLIANLIEAQSTATKSAYAPLNYEAPQVYPTPSATTGTVGEYTANGTTVNNALIGDLDVPGAVAVSGSDVFVVNTASGKIGEYTTNGATVNASLISNMSNATALAVSGSDLFVLNSTTGTIGEYTTAGAVVNASLITGLTGATSFTISGSDIYVTLGAAGTIAEYTTAGAVVNAALVTALNDPSGIAIYNGDMFVTNQATASVGEYTTSGTTVEGSLITGLDSPSGIAVSSTGLLYVLSSTTGGISKYDQFGDEYSGDLVGGLDEPGGIALSGNDIFVTSAASPLPNNLTLQVSGSLIQLYDNTTSSSGLGTLVAVGSTTNTSAITINGAENTTNNLVVNFSGGNPIPAGGLNFDGQSYEGSVASEFEGSGTGGTIGSSSLTLEGTLPGGITSEAIRPKSVGVGEYAGLITLNGTSNINYSNLNNPIIDTAPASNVTYTALGSNNTVGAANVLGVMAMTLPGGVKGTEVYSSTALFDPDEFANKTNVTFTDSDGNDTLGLNFNNGNPLPAGGLTFNGGTGKNTVTVVGNNNFTLSAAGLTDSSTGGGALSLLNVQNFSLTGGAGNNIFTITGWTGSGTINGGGGTDTVKVLKGANVNMGANGNLIGSSDGMLMTINGITSTVMQGSGSNVSYTVNAWPASSGALWLNGFATANTYNIGTPQTENLDMITQQVFINALNSNNTVILNDTKNISFANYTATATLITSKHSQYQGNTARPFAGVSVRSGSLSNVTVNSNIYGSTFFVTPSATTAFAMYETNTAATLNPTLLSVTNVNSASLGATLFNTNAAGTQGMFMFPADKPINFKNMPATGGTNFTGSSGAINAVTSAAGTGSQPNVQIINSATGQVLRTLTDVYPASYKGGVQVAVGDVNGDGVPDVIVAPGVGETPLIEVYSVLTGLLEFSFLAEPSSFNYGLQVAVGDVLGNGRQDIITAPLIGAASVNVFLNNGSTTGNPFSAYSASTPTINAFSTVANYVGGVGGLAVGNVTNNPATAQDANGVGDIIVGSGLGTPAVAEIFNYAKNGTSPTAVGTITPNFSAAVTDGIALAVGEIESDGSEDVVMGAGANGSGQIDVWNSKTNGTSQFTAFTGTNIAPVHVAIAKVNGAGDILAAQGSGANNNSLQTFTSQGALVDAVMESNSYLLDGIDLG